MKNKYLFFINYIDNKKCILLKNKCLQLNIVSCVFSANIVGSVFGSKLKFLKSKILILATNEDPLVAKINNFDFELDYLFLYFNGIFLNLDISKFIDLQLFYNNNFLFVNYYIVLCYVNLVLIIYWWVCFFFELLKKIIDLKADGVINLYL
jgi:hypothetical protein